jgi:hypothetical protein
MKMVEDRVEELEDALTHEQAVELDQLSKDYQSVFLMPATLPSLRLHDHLINLDAGLGIVNIWHTTLLLTHIQKAEIERAVKEMFDMGIVWPITSPFSSPVLLVKKKDGSWKFCVD